MAPSERVGPDPFSEPSWSADPEAGPPPWKSCWPTADETALSFCCPLEDGPWLAARALEVVRQASGARSDPSRERYAVGSGGGAPLILGEPLIWHGLRAVLETCQTNGQATGEVTLRLPPWGELALGVAEEAVWELADQLAVELGSACGVISDGRAIGYPDLGDPERATRNLQLSHLGVMVPRGWSRYLRPASNPYTVLPLSQLVVVLE